MFAENALHYEFVMKNDLLDRVTTRQRHVTILPHPTDVHFKMKLSCPYSAIWFLLFHIHICIESLCQWFDFMSINRTYIIQYYQWASRICHLDYLLMFGQKYQLIFLLAYAIWTICWCLDKNINWYSYMVTTTFNVSNKDTNWFSCVVA